LEQRSFLVGYVSTGNSLGCLAGTITGIFFLIPVLGSERSLKLIILSVAAIGVLFLRREAANRKEALAGIAGFAVLLALAGAFHWERLVLTSGINTYFGGVGPSAAVQGPDRSLEMIFFHEDPQGGMTTVLQFTRRDNGAQERVLLSNGKFEGSDDLEKQGLAQIGFVAIPSLFVKHFDRALLIGLGTGHSALALARAGYQHIDVAEFAPGIVDAARTEFSRLNESVLSFPNVHLNIEDGRHVLLTGRGRDYDLITIEVASIWFAGATNVYSREFYHLARSRLRPGGVLQQWVQLHHISPREIDSAIATTRAVFPYVSFWFAGGQGMIVAGMEPQTRDAERETLVTGRMSSLIHRDPADANRIARGLLQTQVATPPAIDRMIAAGHPVINTDHNRWIEYATPRYNVSSEDWVARNLAALRGF